MSEKEMLDNLSRVISIMQNLEAERTAHNQCLYDAILELPSGMREIVWDKYNDLMRQWRGAIVKKHDLIDHDTLDQGG